MAPGQLRVLYALDVARTQLYHFMPVVIAGMGFFTEAYDFFAVSLVMDLIGYQYYQGHTPRGVSAAISAIALCGAIPGQLMGRKRIYGAMLVLMVITFLASGLSFRERKGKNVVTVLCFFRFWLGVSIGGDYPLSATTMSEYANRRRRGALIATVFVTQRTKLRYTAGPGYFAAFAFVDRIGRVRIQLLGFTMMSVFVIGLAAPYDQHWSKHKDKYGFAVMYAMTTFFVNFGPNTTVFVIPAEIFPTRLRSACHGIAGAFGKMSAIVGVFAFRYNENHVPRTLFELVACNIAGIVFTLLLP
ncbi:unnamed protein product [Urochloa decumbens]|uniref:H(+)/Pi cotransporter n=1 Tax=Urochloa decumbens TaxID=240449 RepID=A0ABC9HEK8_9POAL